MQAANDDDNRLLGCVAIASTSDFVLKDEKSAHSAAITLMEWNKDGTRLITGDAVRASLFLNNDFLNMKQNGVVCVWKVDPIRDRLMNMCTYKKAGAITRVAYGNRPLGLDQRYTRVVQTSMAFTNALRKIDASKMVAFFFAGDNGTVSYADDLGHCQDVSCRTRTEARLTPW